MTITCRRISSGARYHLVTTYAVSFRLMVLLWTGGSPFAADPPDEEVPLGGSSGTTRDRPKSQIFNEQSSLSRMLAGCKPRAQCKQQLVLLYSSLYDIKGIGEADAIQIIDLVLDLCKEWLLDAPVYEA